MGLRIESSVVPWLIVAAAPALALTAAGCGEDFESCVASRTCASAGKGGSGGNAGEAGATEAPLNGGSSGTGGSRGGAAGTSGDAGAAGDGSDGGGGSAARGGTGGSSGNANGDSGNGGEGGDGEPTDPCEGVTCERGVCTNVDGEGVCECETGFAGTACELPAFEWVELLEGHDHALAQVLAENGTVVGRSCNSSDCGGKWRGFRWTHEDGAVPFEGLNGDARDANRDASVVVAVMPSRTVPYGAFRWTEASGFVDLGVLPADDPDSYPYSYAFGVSADGTVVVGASYEQPFRWTSESGMVTLAAPDGWSGDWNGSAFAVSDDNSIIVGSLGYSSKRNIVRWISTGEAEWIEPSRDAGATAMSADGEVIVGNADVAGVSEAFRWTRAGGIVSLGRPSECSSTEAFAVSGDGRAVAVVCTRPDDGTRSYLWNVEGGYRRLKDVLESIGMDASDADVVGTTDLSFDGRTILGFTQLGGDRNQSRPWVARIPAPHN